MTPGSIRNPVIIFSTQLESRNLTLEPPLVDQLAFSSLRIIIDTWVELILPDSVRKDLKLKLVCHFRLANIQKTL